MWQHSALSDKTLFRLIHAGSITIGGYSPKKIYGLLSCESGKRMKKHNRVFFENIHTAIDAGYRPCGHCMKLEFELWKSKH